MSKIKQDANSTSPRLIDELVRFISLRKEQKQDPYILFLGAGCSVTSGYLSMEDFMRFALNDLESKSIPLGQLRSLFDDFWRSKSPTERYAIFKSSVRDGNPSAGYGDLAMLVREGYFSTIFTINMDSLLEDSLRVRADLGSSQLRVLVLPDDARDFQARLHATTPPVKVIKLHGDAESFLFPFTRRETREIGMDVERVLRDFLSQDLIIVGSSMQDWDIRRCLPNEGGSMWFVGPTVVPVELETAMSLRNCEKNTIVGEHGHFDAFFRYLAKKLIQLPEPLTEWESQFSTGNLTGIQSIFGPYGFQDGKMRFPGNRVSCIRIQGFFGKDVLVEMKFRFVDPKEGNRNNWLGVWARGMSPSHLDGNLAYLRKSGRAHIFCPEGRELQTAGESVDTTQPVDFCVKYSGRDVTVRINSIEFATAKDDEDMIIDRPGFVFVQSYKAAADIEQIKISPID